MHKQQNESFYNLIVCTDYTAPSVLRLEENFQANFKQ